LIKNIQDSLTNADDSNHNQNLPQSSFKPHNQVIVTSEHDQLISNVLPKGSVCNLESLTVPFVLKVEFPKPLAEINAGDLNQILNSLQEQSVKGAQILFTFPSE